MILNVYFFELKTSQRRLLMNMLNTNFIVKETKKEIDVLFVNELKKYDIPYKLIFPYSEIIIDKLNDIIFEVIRTYKKRNITTNIIIPKIKKHITSPLINLEQDLLELKKILKMENKNICSLNIAYDEVLFLNKDTNYNEWDIMNKMCIIHNLFIKRIEYRELNYNIINTFIDKNPNSLIIVDDSFDNIQAFVNVKHFNELELLIDINKNSQSFLME